MVRTGEVVGTISMEFEVLNAYVAPNETIRIEMEAEVQQ
jgi:hypothetical protein